MPHSIVLMFSVCVPLFFCIAHVHWDKSRTFKLCELLQDLFPFIRFDCCLRRLCLLWLHFSWVFDVPAAQVFWELLKRRLGKLFCFAFVVATDLLLCVIDVLDCLDGLSNTEVFSCKCVFYVADDKGWHNLFMVRGGVSVWSNGGREWEWMSVYGRGRWPWLFCGGCFIPACFLFVALFLH